MRLDIVRPFRVSIHCITFKPFILNPLTSVSFSSFLDDKEWDGVKNWLHIGFTSQLEDGEKKTASFVTNTTNTVHSTDSYFSNGVESYVMDTDVDIDSGQGGGTYQTLFIDIIHTYSRNLHYPFLSI